MGVWAMRTRLHYFFEPVETLNDKVFDCDSSQERKLVYQRTKEFQQRLQFRVNQLLNKNLGVEE